MNVIDLLTERNLKYKESGKDYSIHCLNPEHDDSNPSMNVDKITGVFHCFSCGFKGNIFNYFGAAPNFLDIRIAHLQEKIQNILSDKRV